jgi:hypothetical protein
MAQELGAGESVVARLRGERGQLQLGAGDLVPHRTVLLLEHRIRGDPLPEVLLEGLLPLHDGLIQEAREVATHRLLGVLQPQDGGLEAPGVLGGAGRQLPIDAQARLVAGQPGRIVHIPQVLHLRQGEQATRAPRVSYDEGRLSLRRARHAPLQVLLGADGLPVLVGPEEAHVQAVSGIGEVVRIAAEVAGLQLRRHDQAQVVVPSVGVERVHSSVVQGDHLTPEARVLLAGRAHLLHGRLTLRHPPGIVRGRDASADTLGYVHRPDQLVHVHVGTLDLRGPGLRDEAGPQVVGLGRRHGGDTPSHAVVVGHDQTVLRDERRRAARETNRGQAEVIEPFLVRGKAVPHLPVVEGGCVEGPHGAELGHVAGREGPGLLCPGGKGDSEEGDHDDETNEHLLHERRSGDPIDECNPGAPEGCVTPGPSEGFHGDGRREGGSSSVERDGTHPNHGRRPTPLT